MNNKSEEGYELGEFVSFELIEDKNSGKFTLTLAGDIRYANLVSEKVGGLRVTDAELNDWVEADEGVGDVP